MHDNKVNIAVLVSGGGTNLQAILDAQRGGKLVSGRVRLVVSNKPGVYALERAQNAGVETLVLERKVLGREQFEKELSRALREREIGLIVLAGFLCILSAEFCKQWEKRIINIHPSLIPAFCGEGYWGLKVHETALKRGVRVTGATVHFVNEIPDGGEIIDQLAVRVMPGDTPEKLQKRVMEQAEWKLLPAAAETVCKNILEG